MSKRAPNSAPFSFVNTIFWNPVGIKHLMDLDPSKFVEVVHTLPQYTASEKYDGANLWFGIEGGEVYVSREGKNKSATKTFTPGNFEDVAANDQFKAALIALSTAKTKIASVLDETDVVECEVILGSQPNVVTYADNDTESRIIFLRMVSGDQTKLQKLFGVLQNTPVPVEMQVKHTEDGKNLIDDTLKTTFSFGIVTQKQITDAVTSDSVLVTALSGFDAYAKQNDAALTNTATDEAATTKKTEVTFRMNSMKQKIIDRLLHLLNATPTGEGIVLTNIKTGEMYKLVNKSKFGRTNEFFQRGRKTAVGTILTTDRNADFFKRGGIVGDTKIQLATVLGFPDFARAQPVRQSLAQLGQSDFLNQFQVTDVNKTKMKMLAIVDVGIASLNTALEKFKTTGGGAINIDGQQVSYSEPVKRRTLIAFAEANAELNNIKTQLVAATTKESLISAVFSRFINLNTVNESKQMNRIYSLMQLNEDEGAQVQSTPGVPNPPSKPDVGTKAGDIANKPGQMSTGSDHKVVMRARNTAVLAAIRRSKLMPKTGK